MVNSKQALIGVTIVAVVAAIVMTLTPSDEKAIRKQFTRLSESAQKEAGTATLKEAVQAQGMVKFLNDPCTFNAGIPGMTGQYSRRQAAQAIMFVRSRFTDMKLDFHDLDIEVADEANASVQLTAKLRGTAASEPFSEVREISCTMRKVDGDWLIVECKAVAVLRK